jgi:hypothetical protein
VLAVYPSVERGFSTASTLELSGGEAVRLERNVRRLQLPPIFDGKLNCLVWIFAKRHNFLPKNFYVPPGAARITTGPIWITMVLKLQMEAKPVHPLENFVGHSILFHGKVAANTNERFLGHDGFHDV